MVTIVTRALGRIQRVQAGGRVCRGWHLPSGPDKRFWVSIVLGKVSVDSALEVDDRQHSATKGRALPLTGPDFHRLDRTSLPHSFDDLVGSGGIAGGYREAEVFRGLEVDDEIELHRLPDRQIAGLGALQDAIDVVRGAAEIVRHIRSVGHQAAIVDILAVGIDRRQARCVDHRHDVPAVIRIARPGE